MAYNRALIGIAGTLVAAAGGLGVDKFQLAQLTNLPAGCVDAINRKLADSVIQSLCPPGTNDHTLAAFVVITGLVVTFLFVTSPVGDFVQKLIKRETI